MKIEWKRTIDEKDRSFWEALFCSDILKAFDLHMAIDRSKIKNFKPEYLYIKKGNTPVAIIPCFSYMLELDLLTVSFVKRIIAIIRKIVPGFFKVNIFFVGTSIALCDHMIGIRSSEEKEYKNIFNAGFMEIIDRSKKNKSSFIIFKEIPAHDTLLLKCFYENNIVIGKSLPNSYILLDSRLGKWTDAFRTRYRRRIRRQVKKTAVNTDFQWKIINDYGQHACIFESLYLQVLKKSDYKFETLNSNFFKFVSEGLPENSRAFICTNSENKIVCFELILAKDEVLVPIYVGLDYAYRDSGDLYFSCIHNIVLFAEKNGYKKIKFGQTSYLAKAYAGCIFEELFIGIFARNPFIHRILKLFNKFIFTAPPIPSVHVYRDDMQVLLEQICIENNIVSIKTDLGKYYDIQNQGSEA